MNIFGRKNDSEEKTKRDWKLLTKETIGMIIILFSSLALLCLITVGMIFGEVSKAVASFLTGTFGWGSVLICLYGIFGGVELVKGSTLPVARRYKALFTLTVIFVMLIAQAASTAKLGALTYGKYLTAVYNMGSDGLKTCSAGGVILGLFDGLMLIIIKKVGCYVLYGIALAVLLTLLGFMLFGRKGRSSVRKAKKSKKAVDNARFAEFDERDISGARDYPVSGNFPDLDERGEKINGLYIGEDDFEEYAPPKGRKNAKAENTAVKILYPDSSGVRLAVGESEDVIKSAEEEKKRKLEYIKTPYQIIPPSNENRPTGLNGATRIYTANQPTANSGGYSEMKPNSNLPPKFTYEGEKQKETPPFMYSDNFKTNEVDAKEYVEGKTREDKQPQKFNTETQFKVEEDATPRVMDIPKFTAEDDEVIIEEETPAEEPPVTNIARFSGRTARGEREENTQRSSPRTADRISERGRNGETARTPDGRGSGLLGEGAEVFGFGREKPSAAEIRPQTAESEEREYAPESKEEFVMPVHIPYNRPPTTIFKQYPQTVGNSEFEHQEKAKIIENTLEQFGIPAKVVSVSQGPTVTRYELQMPDGISVRKVTGVADDLAMHLCAKTGVIIEAPIPGKTLVGIQVENNDKVIVGLRDILESREFNSEAEGKLLYSIGKDIVGKVIVENLAKAPHLLVAGATGTGKSVCLNSLIISLICKYGPEDLRLVMVDPKQVEFTMYSHIPQLLFDEIVTDVSTTIATLDWLVNEMERRYTLFSDSAVSDINMYNEEVANDEIPKLPRIVVIVDELADFMATRKRDMEERIQRLAAKARAAGIHLVLATQRPSVDVITGVIKANLPTRIAARVATATDAMTIHGEGGAEKLLGNGDLLYKSSTMFNVERIQGSFVTNGEIRNVVKYIKDNNRCYFDPKILEQINRLAHPVQAVEESVPKENEKKEGRPEALFDDAVRHVIRIKNASASNLQGKFGIGYSTASRLLQLMVDKGIVTEYDGSKSRRVLMTLEEYEAKFCNGNSEE